ncbi:SlyX family protein [Bartonella sp. TP]|uniref:SlyX family protein n=1 Tax=Bartonella sp. TP TaxID=3057550 RepID=UPI0025AFD56C|nr:SlyX family protein [Bartonella sp. TP]WJW80343.1 SlyX family protein [Bartonella sp. TP]
MEIESLNEQLIDTQLHLMQLQRSVDELSHLVLEQWKIMTSQSNSLKKLNDKLRLLEESSLGQIAITKPPHW